MANGNMVKDNLRSSNGMKIIIGLNKDHKIIKVKINIRNLSTAKTKIIIEILPQIITKAINLNSQVKISTKIEGTKIIDLNKASQEILETHIKIDKIRDIKEGIKEEIMMVEVKVLIIRVTNQNEEIVENQKRRVVLEIWTIILSSIIIL